MKKLAVVTFLLMSRMWCKSRACYRFHNNSLVLHSVLVEKKLSVHLLTLAPLSKALIAAVILSYAAPIVCSMSNFFVGWQGNNTSRLTP